MRLRQLRLTAFGPFSDTVLDFDPAHGNLFLVHGRNEAGKSSTLRAMCDLRYGIHPQSGDNFVHDYADLAIGAVLVDAQGRSHSLVRRKKRDSLSFHDFAGPAQQPFQPVPADVEALLTGGLRREDFLNLFGLDHARLRKGGEALASGEGDLGAALFEASAGVRSIPALLAALDGQAKAHYIPRGKNARINLALAQYDEQHAEHKRLLVRPTAWADLNREHGQAKAELDRLRLALKARRERQLLIGELRAVAPLLADLQATVAALGELGTAPLLSKDSGERRVAAETKLGEARAGAASAQALADGLTQQIAALTLDTACLQLAPAIARLDAAQEQIDTAARDLRDAGSAEQTARHDLDEAARAIDATRSADDLLALAPTPAQRSTTAAALDRIERLHHKLQTLADALSALPPAAEAALPQPPHPQVCLELRAAIEEAARLSATAERLAALPRAIAAAERALQAALTELALDLPALKHARPLLDHEIDAEVQALNDAASRREGWQQRIAQLDAALGDAAGEHQALVGQGAVPTPADVAEARQHRDAGWALVRRVHIDREPAHAGEQAPPAAYEAAVQTADRLVDALSRDAERAAQLQTLRQRIAGLQHDRQHLIDQLASQARDAESRQAQWTTRLLVAGLPATAPASLRQWQQRLAQGRQLAENG